MRVASKPKIKAKAKVKPVKARPKPKTKPKRKWSAVALDVDAAIGAALESARASVMRRRRTEDAETAYIFSVSHPTPCCCDGAESGLSCCDGGCLKDRPEVPWAAHQEVNLAYASERFAEAS